MINVDPTKLPPKASEIYKFSQKAISQVFFNRSLNVWSILYWSHSWANFWLRQGAQGVTLSVCLSVRLSVRPAQSALKH